MSLFNGPEEEKTDSTQHPEEMKIEEAAAQEAPAGTPPPNEYWVRDGQSVRNTTPHGYGQGYQQPPYQSQNPGGYVPYNQNGYGQGYPPPQQGQPPYRPSQYQYSPNSGWQQPPARPQENYQWNFQDYEKAAGDKAKKKKNRGLVVFVVALICVLSIGLIAISAYGVYSYIGDKGFAYDGLNDGESAEDRSVEAQLEIASKPQITESLPVGGKMTVPQVAKAVGASVVGVIQYRPDVYLEETGAGSGIIMTADGYVITNEHVVAGGTAFKVVLSDGTPKDAELVGTDSLTDLAVLKISGVNDLVPAVFGDSTQIEVGELVVAIGNPAGSELLAGSVTQGIVSAVDREIPTVKMPLIQTDAAINPGNSGGALVNEYGQVIGINSQKIVAEGFEGIGFAIPISEAKPIIDDIVSYGRVKGRVKLGITARAIDEIDARSAGLQMGIRIEEIDPESDLANKDVQKFDIITHIDGERVYTMYELKDILERHKPGDRVTLTLFRQIGLTRSETHEVTVILLEE